MQPTSFKPESKVMAFEATSFESANKKAFGGLSYAGFRVKPKATKTSGYLGSL